MLLKRTFISQTKSLNTLYRPCSLSEMLGNEVPINILRNYFDEGSVPHTILFTGPAGCGKTTAARIVAMMLNCAEGDKDPCMRCPSCLSIAKGMSMDCLEINVGKDGGKHEVAAVVDDLPSAPFASRYKVVIFDEAHKLTTAAKDLLLKYMEDGMPHVYLMFCTNRPEELRNKKSGGDSFLGRCATLNFKPLSYEETKRALINILEFEGVDYNEDVVDYLVVGSKGVPRDALVSLGSIIAEGSWTLEAAKIIMGDFLDSDDPDIRNLAQAINKTKWKEVCSIYARLLKDMPTESIRISLTAYFVACLKNAKTIGETNKFSAVLYQLSHTIPQQSKLAEHVFYNMLYKALNVCRKK